MKNKQNIIIIIAGIAVIILIGMSMQEKPTLGERLENAGDEISDGFEDAGEELDPDRSTGEKVGDAIEDAGEEIKEMTE